MNLRTLLWLSLALMAPAMAAEPLPLNEALRIAESRAPQLAAAQAQELAAREMAVASRQLPDPVLKMGVNNFPISGEAAWSLTREGMTMRSIGLMQEFTRYDKREARASKASREAELAQVQRRAALSELRRETALGWLDLAYQNSMRGYLAQQLDELTLQIQSAEAAFRAGRGEQAEIFGAQASRERLRDQLAQMDRDIVLSRIGLARWLGSDAERPLTEPPPLPLSWTPADLNAHSAEHPTLAAQQSMVALAEAEARVARENRTPDIAVELMYNQRGPSFGNMIALNVSMPLPWDRPQRQDRELGASLAKLDQARAQQEDMQRSYLATVNSLLTAWEANRKRVEHYDKTLIALAAQQTNAALAAYRAGSGSLTRVLEARRMSIETRMERQRIALEAARNWAELDFLNPSQGAQ